MAIGEISPRGEVKDHVFQGVEDFKEIWKSLSDRVLVIFDPDVDGLIAGYLVCKYLALQGKKFEWYINSNRSHDWTIPIPKLGGRDIIAVDFIITAEKVAEIVDAGSNLVSMDHHKNGDVLIKYKSGEKSGLVINNQYPFEDEDSRYLSGAGVVFETFVAMDARFDTLLNRQLVGITLLSDIRDIENPLAEGYLYRLYSDKCKQGFLRYLVNGTLGEKDYDFGIPRMDRNYVDFKFSPAINANLRFNQQDDVVRFILNGKPLDLSWRKEQKELTKKLKDVAKVVELVHLRVVFFNEWDILSGYELSNFVGLLASQFLDGEKSVICYMIAEDDSGRYIKRVSFRGRVNGLDYNKALSKEGMFQCLGHGPAFGIKGLVPSADVFKKIDKICYRVEQNSGYSPKIVNVANLSMYSAMGRAREIAEDNMYKLSQNQTKLRYIGHGVVKKTAGANYMKYEVDGVPVVSFDVNLNFKIGLISPVLNRGYLVFYLE